MSLFTCTQFQGIDELIRFAQLLRTCAMRNENQLETSEKIITCYPKNLFHCDSFLLATIDTSCNFSTKRSISTKIHSVHSHH